MTGTQWFIPSTQGGEEDSLNEPAIEFFQQPGLAALRPSGAAR